MLNIFLKRLAARLPRHWQQELKRLHFARMVKNGSFTSAEAKDKEYDHLDEWVSPGDWVLDIGANVGNYSARLSQLVGREGRVFAFEPLSDTFEILTSNMARLPLRNVTLFNVAVSESTGLQAMSLPLQESGLVNPYMAALTGTMMGDIVVLCLSIDALALPKCVRLVKVDVEGHELSALKSMRKLLERDRPLLIVEGHDAAVEAFLATVGYRPEERERSVNRVFRVIP